MNILVFSQHFLPAKGGSINWLINIYSYFSKDQVSFVAGCYEGDSETDASFPYRVHRVNMYMDDWDPTIPKSFIRYIKIIRQVIKICHQERVSQIHCAKVFPEGLVALFIWLIKRIPYCLFAHGEETTTASTSRKFRLIMPIIYSKAASVIANSSNTKRIVESLGIADTKIHVINPCVHVERFSNAAAMAEVIREKYNLINCPVLLTVGRLQLRKGHDIVIRSLPQVITHFPSVKYLIVGVGEELETLQQLALQSGVDKNVIFAGSVSDDELPCYYGACDLFLMVNRELENKDIEGFGIVFLEAAAAKKAVIGGNSGGTADAIVHGETGLLIDGSSVDKTARAIIDLLCDPAKSQQMGEAGYLRVKKEFVYPPSAQRVKSISEQIEKTRN